MLHSIFESLLKSTIFVNALIYTIFIANSFALDYSFITYMFRPPKHQFLVSIFNKIFTFLLEIDQIFEKFFVKISMPYTCNL